MDDVVFVFGLITEIQRKAFGYIMQGDVAIYKMVETIVGAYLTAETFPFFFLTLSMISKTTKTTAITAAMQMVII